MLLTLCFFFLFWAALCKNFIQKRSRTYFVSSQQSRINSAWAAAVLSFTKRCSRSWRWRVSATRCCCRRSWNKCSWKPKNSTKTMCTTYSQLAFSSVLNHHHGSAKTQPNQWQFAHHCPTRMFQPHHRLGCHGQSLSSSRWRKTIEGNTFAASNASTTPCKHSEKRILLIETLKRKRNQNPTTFAQMCLNDRTRRQCEEQSTRLATSQATAIANGHWSQNLWYWEESYPDCTWHHLTLSNAIPFDLEVVPTMRFVAKFDLNRKTAYQIMHSPDETCSVFPPVFAQTHVTPHAPFLS